MIGRNENQTLQLNSNGTLTVAGTCRITKAQYSVTVPGADYARWMNGGLIQNVFPQLSAGDREWLQTGISPDGFDRIFPPEED